MKSAMSATASGLFLVIAAAPAVRAGSPSQPGGSVGLAVGAPLPEGVFFLPKLDWGERNTNPSSRLLTIDSTVAWATPWTVLGARAQVVAAPSLVRTRGEVNTFGLFEPFLSGMLAWDLGNEFGVSYGLGFYIPVHNSVSIDSGVAEQRLAVSYTGHGWNLTVNAIYGIPFDKVSHTLNPDYFNLDLTATKRFGKLEVGPVAFGSSDLNKPIAGYQKQSQIAVGWLVGFDFGPLTLQAYVTRDVYQDNYGGYDTRVWVRFILPLWMPRAAPAPQPRPS